MWLRTYRRTGAALVPRAILEKYTMPSPRPAHGNSSSRFSVGNGHDRRDSTAIAPRCRFASGSYSPVSNPIVAAKALYMAM